MRELAIRLNDPPEVLVEVACLSKWGPVADQLRDAGVEVTALAAAGVTDVRVLWRFVKLARERKFDTVFSFLMHANVIAAIGSLFLRDVRFIQSIQTTQAWPKWHWKLQGIAQEFAEKIVVPSESVARVAGEWSAIPRDKIEVIPNAIDVPRDTGFQPVLNRSHGPEARVTVGFLGRLDPVKRVPDLVEAMSHLGRRFELHIYGEGSDRLRIESTIARLALQERVTLYGATTTPQAAIGAMDVLVLPSEAEGFGLVLIEAMAARVPVIATDVAGIRDVVRHEQTGLLVPVGQPEKIAGAIQRIVEDDALRQSLIERAFDDVQQRFTWPIVLKQYRRLLNLEPT